MINLAVFFGGASCEHDISIITGLQLISKINEYLYNIIPIYIDKNGAWLTGENLKDIDNFPDNLGKLKTVGVVANDNTLFIKKKSKCKAYLKIDVAILCLHGINGEDGSVSGVLEQSKIPYSNCSILPSSVCMDKCVFNDVCRGLNIPKVEYMSISKANYDADNESVFNNVIDFGLPVIIKPSRQGSSIGIQICKKQEDLKGNLESAFEYDDRLVIEKFIDLKKEVNIGCFYNKGELIFSKTEEPISKSEYLNFDEKYQSNLSGMESMKRISPAKITLEEENQIKNIAGKLYHELDMFGVVRFDFMMDKENNLFINEANTIPGSMANYLFGDDFPYTKLIEDMITNALLRFQSKRKIKKDFESGVLEQGLKGFKK